MKKILLVLSLLFITTNAHATNFYISPSGLGSMNGTTAENAYAWNTGGATTALAAAVAGDHIIFIKGYGHYAKGIGLTINKSGSLDTPKTFTVVTATDVFTSTAHGYSNGDMVKLTTTSALPSFSWRDEFDLTVATFDSSATGQGYQSELYLSYIVSDVTADTFKLRPYEDGPVIDVTTTGTGTQSVAKVNFIYIEGQGFDDPDGISGTVIDSYRDIPEGGGGSPTLHSSGGNPFPISAGISNIKISNLRMYRVQIAIQAIGYTNNNIYIQDVFVDHVRETLLARGYINCTFRDHEKNCLLGSHGWIVDNLDSDYMTKHHIRNEMGWHHSTIANCNWDGRYITGDFNLGTHFATGPSNFNYYMTYQTGTGTVPHEGQILTGATSGAKRYVRGYVGNTILGAAVKGSLQLPAPSTTLPENNIAFTVGEIVTDPLGFSAAVSGYQALGNDSLGHNFLVYNSSGKRDFQNESVSGINEKYDNGDAFSSEGSAHDIIYIGCGAYDNADGGWDIKGFNHKIINGRCARSGNRCIRIWNGPSYISNTIVKAGQGEITRLASGGVYGGAAFWFGGIMYLDKVSVINGPVISFDTGNIASLTYSGGTGGLPIVPHNVFDQTTGGYLRVLAYTGNASSGTLYFAANGGVVAGNVIAGSGFSATVGTISGAGCYPYSVTDSLIYQDLDHQASGTVWTTATCPSSGTFSGNISCVEGGTCTTDPQLVNPHDNLWEGENNSFNPQNVAVQGITGGYLPVSAPTTYIRTIGGSGEVGQ